MDPVPRLAPYVDKVESALRTALQDLAPPELREAAAHYPQAGGKRLRPAMTLLACEAAGGRADDALPFAVAIELVHNFSLVHDDIMDRDLLRRGMPTVHAKWGEATAILAGDALLAKAFEVVAEGPGRPEARVRALLDLATSTRVLCEGQALDMAFERSDTVTPEAYLHMIRAKTGRLFEVACRGAAYYAGGDDAVVRPLETYGEAFGEAFQVHDDLLDLAPTKTTGKPFGSDLRAGKKTLVVLEGRARLAGSGDAGHLARVLGRRDATEAEVEDAVRVLRACGAVDATRAVVVAASARAEGALRALPETPARGLLADLARWAAEREA